ncbi:MAG: NAD(P)-binding domain-containing protein [Acidimicrobiales bacterium]
MRIPVIVIGAGPAGLAMSHQLMENGLDHVVLERGEVANSWRIERWDSLRLLTPNWMSGLPGHRYRGDDPDGFMTASEAATFLDEYQRTFAAPVMTHVAVERVERTGQGFEVTTDAGLWQCDAVVAATGASSEPRIPVLAAEMPKRIEQLTALRYRNPSALAREGSVLVVGASASGIQIADELRRAGRDVTIAIGEHVRLPRSYRGRDIYWWLDRIGQLDERYDEVDDIERARRHASVQLVGSEDHRTLDLNALSESGVQLVARLVKVIGTTAQFSGALANLAANADLKQTRLLDRIDAFVAATAFDGEVFSPLRPPPTRLATVPTELDLSAFSTVIWATGYRPSYSWLDPSARDHRGRVAHDGGVADFAGLYLLGLPFMRRRGSNLIGGVGADVADMCTHLRGYLDVRARSRGGYSVTR